MDQQGHYQDAMISWLIVLSKKNGIRDPNIAPEIALERQQISVHALIFVPCERYIRRTQRTHALKS
jgi:hypothetical protein